ncbi:MAG: cytochrome c maturation protein CcmE, partial [Pseudomonadota bacterium]
MRSLKKQRRIQIIALALVCLVGATALIGFALRDGINLFRSPSQVQEAAPSSDEVFRLGGLVVEGSIAPGDGVQFG